VSGFVLVLSANGTKRNELISYLCVERTGTRRSAHSQLECQWWLVPAAHAFRWIRNINKSPQQKGAKGMKLTIIMCLLGLLASLVLGCKTPGKTSDQRSTRETEQMQQTLRSVEAMMYRMDNKLDAINRKLPDR
jgi:hypothetical protein